MKRTTILAVLSLLAACGGPAPFGEPRVPSMADLGLISSSTQTTFTLDVINMSEGAIAVTSIEATGVVSADTSALPRSLAPGETGRFPVGVTPAGPGPISEVVTTQLVNSHGALVQSTTAVVAEAEPVVLDVAPATLQFGDVMPGTSAELAVTLTNHSAVSVARVSGVDLTSSEFAVVDSLPFEVAAQSSADLTVRCDPSAPGTPSAVLTLTTNSTQGAHAVGLEASAGGQEVIDLGTRAFDGNGDTGVMTFDVAADAIAFMIEATTSANTVLGLRLLSGPAGEAFETEALDGAYLWRPQAGLFTAQVPNTDKSDVQLVAGGGTYALRLLRWSGNAPSCDVRIVVERRPVPETRERGKLDLNVFLANAIPPTAATATSDNRLQSVLSAMATILDRRDIEVGDIDYYDVTDPTYDDVSESEFGPMLRLSAMASKVRLNLFFVRTAIGGGVLGVSPTLGGPQRNGTELSGVMSVYSQSYSPSLIGLVAAHEIGHFLGLAHTQEQNGSHDNIDDTDECPACTGPGGGYLMHWQAVGGTDITRGQGLVIWGHPHMSPAAAPGGGSPKPAPSVLDFAGDSVPENWCATCTPR